MSKYSKQYYRAILDRNREYEKMIPTMKVNPTSIAESKKGDLYFTSKSQHVVLRVEFKDKGSNVDIARTGSPGTGDETCWAHVRDGWESIAPSLIALVCHFQPARVFSGNGKCVRPTSVIAMMGSDVHDRLSLARQGSRYLLFRP